MESFFREPGLSPREVEHLVDITKDWQLPKAAERFEEIKEWANNPFKFWGTTFGPPKSCSEAVAVSFEYEKTCLDYGPNRLRKRVLKEIVCLVTTYEGRILKESSVRLQDHEIPMGRRAIAMRVSEHRGQNEDGAKKEYRKVKARSLKGRKLLNLGLGTCLGLQNLTRSACLLINVLRR